VEVIRSGRTYLLLAQLLLSSFQKRLGNKLDIKPGAEMLRALDLAEELGLQPVCADRDIRTTLKRTWSAMGWWSLGKLAFSLAKSAGESGKIDQAEIERLKTSDALNELMKEFSEALPEVRRTLIDERDQYLATKIRFSPGNSVVAIVGAGHVPGIKLALGLPPADLVELDILPKRSLLTRIVGWSIPALAIALLLYGFLDSGTETSLEMIKTWVIVNGTFAAIGAILALAHPLSILAAFISAPFTSLNPFLASGWVAGLVEAILRKPRVSDLETVTEDITSLKGLWGNRLTRILLVVSLTNLTGTVGAIIGVQQIAVLLVK